MECHLTMHISVAEGDLDHCTVTDKLLLSFHSVDFVLWDGMKLTGYLSQYFALHFVTHWKLYLSVHSGGYIMCFNFL